MLGCWENDTQSFCRQLSGNNNNTNKNKNNKTITTAAHHTTPQAITIAIEQ